MFRSDRVWNDNGDPGYCKRGGGLMCYAKDNLRVSDSEYEKLNYSTKDLEIQWISVHIDNLRPIVILNLYRPPQGDYKKACKIINDSISEANLKNNTEIYLMGDFNINLSEKSSPQCKELLFVAGSNGLLPKIKSTTRHSCRNGIGKDTCIDQIFTNSELIVEAKTLDLNISDHLAVYVRRKRKRQRYKKVACIGRSYRHFVREDFQEALIDSDWGEFYASENPDICWQIIEDSIRKILDDMCPQRNFKVKDIKEPWITDEILEEIKDNYLKIARTTGDERDWIMARRERNRVGKLVKAAKAEFVKERQRELKGEPKKFWKAISSIFPSNKKKLNTIELTDRNDNSSLESSDTADYINNFFTSIGAELASKSNDPWKFFGSVSNESCPDISTDYEQVLNLCKEINVVKSSGFGDIASKVFKHAFMVLIPQLVYLFNLSLSSGIFPKRWKQATVIPLFKGGDRANVGNYRPISLLPLPSKLIEKIVHEKLSKFLEDKNIISEKQSGFRKGFSTASAVADLTDDLFSAINTSEVSMAVFVDLKKAFDSVSHDILCSKLDRLGIRGMALDWCLNYLSDRSQVVLANNVRSGPAPINFGVPQGSVLGPLFFILYINDLQRALDNNIKVRLYADDTVVYVSGKNVETLTRTLQLNLHRLNRWCRANKLTLNPAKTKMMCFGTRQAVRKVKLKALFIGGKQIQHVATFKYLGYILDSTLSYKPHVTDVLNKVIHKKILLSKIRPFLHTNVALLVYKTMILPYFDYCDVIYNSACKNDLDKLQRLQNKCLKTCLNMHNLTETKAVHSSAKSAFLEPRRKAHLCNFMFKRQCREELIDDRDINTRLHDAPVFHVNFPIKETFKRSVLYSGAVLWNELPTNLRSMDNFSVFKAHQTREMNESYVIRD